MSDAPSPQDGPEPASPADAAHRQQLALEQALRIEELERTVDALRAERAELIEHARVLRAHTGLEGAARELKTRAKARARAVRQRVAVQTPGLPLASFPVSEGSAAVRWVTDVDVAGERLPALIADPPATWSWDVRLPAGAALRGALALKPGAWDMNHGGVDLVVELLAPAGAPGASVDPADAASSHDAGESSDASARWVPVTSLVVSADPAARAADRTWIPWRLALPGSGPHRIVLTTRVPHGASPDYAWALVGDPRLEVPGLAPRPDTGRAGGRGRASSRRAASVVARAPKISLLMPVHDPDVGLLDRTIAAVMAQTSSNWELCIVDDGSKDRLVQDRLARAAAEDPRVKLRRHDTAQGISGATNAALTLAVAPYVATLDHDDILTPDAVASMADELAARPELDFLYSDNDLLAGEGRRFAAALKPDWSPDLLRACMYTLHFAVYRRSAIEQLGGWRTEFDGAQDHDLVLRLSERTRRIGHLPRVLYHWRAHAGSAALGELAKPLAYDRGRQAIAEHLQRTGHQGAQVERLPQAGRYRVRYPRSQPVTLLIPVPAGHDANAFGQTVAALLAVLQPTDAIQLDAPDDAQAQALAAAVVRAIGDPRVRIGTGGAYEPDATRIYFEHAATPATADAIDALASHIEAGARAAGGLVVDGRSRLVAGGVAFPTGLPMPLYPDADLTAADLAPALTMITNVSAVRGVVALAPAAAPVDANAGLGLVAATLAESALGTVVWTPHAQFVASDQVAAALLTWPADEVAALDRGATPDPFWNPLRWGGRGDATVPESVHGSALLDVVDP